LSFIAKQFRGARIHFDPAGSLTKTSPLIFVLGFFAFNAPAFFWDVELQCVTVHGLISVPFALLCALADPVAIANSDAAAIPIAITLIMIASLNLCDSQKHSYHGALDVLQQLKTPRRPQSS
jgi:hypothetical protein